ncbi:DUF6211 family protein [Streptomyces sp. NPDC001251]
MLDDPQASPDQPAILPYDIVTLRPGNRLGIDPAALLTVVDIVEDTPGAVEVHHQQDHPAYWDWAAAITADDVADVIRATAGTVERWSLHPDH